MDELIEAVLITFDEFELMTLNFGWLTFFGCCYDDVVTTHRDNYYKIRNMGNEKVLCNGTQLEALVLSDDALELFDVMGGA